MSIVDLLPEIDRRLTSVLDHALLTDTGALNATEIAVIKGDLQQLVIVINTLARYLCERERESWIDGIEKDANRGHIND